MFEGRTSIAETAAPRSPVGRQVMKLTLAVWAFTLILFLMPQLVATGSVQAFTVPFLIVEIAAGILLSGLLFLLAGRLTRARSIVRFAAMFAAVCAIAFAFSLLDAWLGGLILRIFMRAHVREDPLEMIVSNFISFSWLFGLLATTYVILHANQMLRERELQLAEARSLAQSAQLAALRLQLNPHFLFNTLNAISSLVVTGRNAEGEAMLGKLSSFLRSALSPDAIGTISLGDELEALQTYLEIEAVRFGDRLTVDFVCPDEFLELGVPSFILQPIVENAVKHGVAPTSEPVLIEIVAERDGEALLLTVRNGRGRHDRTTAPGIGVGLVNTARRLDVLYGERASLDTVSDDKLFAVAVRLPLFDGQA